MRTLFLFIAICISSISIAQTTYKPGYYITQKGERVDCLIKNSNWLNSPESITYKLSKEGDKQTINTSELKSFEINNLRKYTNVDTYVDESPDRIVKLAKKRLLVQVLVEGEANLYLYNNFKNRKHFYSVDNSEVKELRHKEYTEKVAITLNNDKTIVKQDNDFLVRLNEDVKCIPTADFVRIEYKSKDLKQHFMDYNACKNAEITFEEKTEKVIYNLNAIAGMNFSDITMNFDLENAILDDSYDLEKKSSITFAAELEIRLPLNNYKNSIFTGIGYQSYESAKDDFEFKYNSVEFHLGLRHYMFLAENSKLLIELSGAFDIVNNSEIKVPPTSGVNLSEVSTSPNISFGVGYKYQKFGIIARYSLERDLLKLDQNISAKQSKIGLLLSYNIL